MIKIPKLYDFKIKIFYRTILLGHLNISKYHSSFEKLYKFLAFTRPVWLIHHHWIVVFQNLRPENCEALRLRFRKLYDLKQTIILKKLFRYINTLNSIYYVAIKAPLEVRKIILFFSSHNLHHICLWSIFIAPKLISSLERATIFFFPK